VINLSAFKAYDIRGRIPDEINADLIYNIGRAYAAFIKPKRVAVGRDIRLTSEEFAQALIRGLTDSGVDVADIGLCGTTSACAAPRACTSPLSTTSSMAA
jgi:phosphomannomutase